jgi:hypothetical protein
MPTRPTKEFPPLTSEKELEEACAVIQAKHTDSLLLYRGQCKLHPTIRSGRNRPNARWEQDVEASWLALVRGIATDAGGSPPDYRMARAVLQHYGLATHFVDLTGDSRTAAWFASYAYRQDDFLFIGNALRMVDRCAYDRVNSSIGYVLVLVFDAPKKEVENLTLFPITDVPGFERPKRQSGWLMYDRQPMLPDPNSHWLYTLRIDRSRFKSSRTQADLFPAPEVDPGFATLLSVPYVQVPLAVVNDFTDHPKRSRRSKSQTKDEALEHWCSARRVIAVPEYSTPGEPDRDYNHKWLDHTLFEPLQMRVWYRWSFDLSTVHPGVAGNIKDTTKITISPGALESLSRNLHRGTLSWPELDEDGLFCTFAAEDHDKVIDHGPPYDGVWIQRNQDMIVETPARADDETLAVGPGHVFVFWDGRLIRQDVPGACKCGHPEKHERRVRRILRLSSSIRKGRVRLTPHPSGFPKWYIAW